MRKIGLYLGVDPSAGGMYQYNLAVLDAVSALPQDQYRVVIAFSSPAWARELHDLDGKVVPAHDGLWRKFFWKVWRMFDLPIAAARTLSSYLDPLVRTLQKEQCDLWIFPSQDTLSFQAAVPALSAIHDLMHRYERRFPEVSEQSIYRHREWSYRNICSWASGILVDSAIGKQQVMESYGRTGERIFVLPYVPPRYMHVQKVPDGFDARYTLPDKFILYPAHFWEHKNHKRLIRAIGLLKDVLPDMHLVLVGSAKDGYRSAIGEIQRLKLEKEIVILGHVSDTDMPELYRRARALVMPTHFGPTNIPPLEAFLVGCPVAVSGIYGIPEQVGDAALLFDPESVEEIAKCIERLWTDDALCVMLAAQGKQRAAAWGQDQFNARLREIIDVVLCS